MIPKALEMSPKNVFFDLLLKIPRCLDFVSKPESNAIASGESGKSSKIESPEASAECRLHWSYSGGVSAISRWLSAATPPVSLMLESCIPKGCQRYDRPAHLVVLVFYRQMLSSLRDMVIGWFSDPVVALRLPPANGYDPFGVKIVQSKRHWALVLR